MQILCTIGLGVPLSFVVNKLFWWSIVNDFHMGRAGEVMSWLLLSLPLATYFSWALCANQILSP